MTQPAKVLVFKGTPALAELQLVSRGLIEGRVCEATSKAPIEGVTVRLWTSAWKLVGAVRTDAAGCYRFEGVDAGPQVVTVDVPATYSAVQAEQSIGGTAARRAADFLLRRAKTVTGRVVDASFGTPLEGIIVAAYNAQGQRIAQGTTGPQGDYEIAGLPDHDVTFRLGS